MAAERKLKGEIDRTLKKVLEGQELFEDLWVQVHETDNVNQREKLEGELKKEIKKLQRLREQIKAWIAGADIKDKQPLMDARKSIEKDMERFKICEREGKQLGRTGATKVLDPKEKAKEDAREWINTTVDSLTAKVEETEYEVEELQGSMKKKQKPPPRLLELEEIAARHKEHISRLEKVLRCIENETIQPEELENLKGDMEMYLGAADGDDDSGLEFSNVDAMYEDLVDRLEAVDQAAPAAVPHGGGKHGSKAKDKEEADKERELQKENERQRAAAAAAKAQLIAQGNTNLKIDSEEKDHKAPATAALTKPAAAPVVATAAAPAGATAGRAAAPAAAQQQADGAAPGASGQVTPAGAPSTPRAGSTVAQSPEPLLGARGGPAGTTAAAAAAPGAGRLNQVAGKIAAAGAADAVFPSLSTPGAGLQQQAAVGPSGQPVNFKGILQQAAVGAGQQPPQQQQQQQPLAGLLQPQQQAAAAQQKGAAAAGKGAAAGALNLLSKASMDGKDAVAGPLSTDGGADKAGAVAAAAAPGDAKAVAGRAPGAQQWSEEHKEELGDAASRAAAGAAAGSSGIQQLELPQVQPVLSAQATKQILEAVYQRAMPQQSDCDWRRYKPRHPTSVPPSYPRTPHEVFDNPNLFRKVDPECLFFAFYFQPDTYQQYLAAHELKRQSWRFHKHHNAWFQRFTEPTVTSEEYEQGAYVYFDYNIVHDDMQTGWCYRRKENFTFRYDALEDELRLMAQQPQQQPMSAAQQQLQQHGAGIPGAAAGPGIAGGAGTIGTAAGAAAI